MTEVIAASVHNRKDGGSRPKTRNTGQTQHTAKGYSLQGSALQNAGYRPALSDGLRSAETHVSSFQLLDTITDPESLLRWADREGATVWTNDNVGEVVPGVITHLTWAVLEPLGNGAFQEFLRRIGVRSFPPEGLFGCFAGRVYFNRTGFQRLLRRFYPSSVAAGSALGRRLRAALALLETGMRAGYLLVTLLREARRYEEAVPQELREHTPPPETLSPPELWQEAERWRKIGQTGMTIHLAVTILAGLLYDLLEKVVTRWRGESDVTAAHLTTGLPDMKSAEVGRELEALAHEARQRPEVQRILCEAPPEVVLTRLRESAAGRAFLSRLAAFMDKHGHASLREFELSYPRWREDPTYIITMLRNRLSSPSSKKPADGKQPLQTLRRQLRAHPFRRLFFELLLYWTRRYSVARENMKYTFVMAHSHLRDVYRALGARLTKQGKLSCAEDIFFLTLEELEHLVQGTKPEIQDMVHHRREQYHRHLEAEPPTVIVEDAAGHRWTWSAQKPTRATVLEGLAASPGRVTGRAKVIHDPRSAHLEAGEILVAPATNPAWSPLLLAAGGLVTEIGGLLSHGAIVAREYGLPAVLNVRDATRLIRTGQRITVDGEAGLVYLEEEA